MIKRIAVDNFLSSIDMTMPMDVHVSNAVRDAVSYRWDSATLDTIIAGISEKYAAKEKQNGR